MHDGITGDVAHFACAVALDEAYTDHDLRRAQRLVEQELQDIRRLRQPIPIDVIYARRILMAARHLRAIRDEPDTAY
ncbi:hypothetical protein [Neoaquamicrobium sediminum]|uniref:hypothetical protein n=1 Tax=Neoaquamicrobium sediminum TaxID=1849104 RepID=UPI001FD2E776|nr:hypothetical protein [Mesorhizobium sediminum]